MYIHTYLDHTTIYTSIPVHAAVTLNLNIGTTDTKPIYVQYTPM